MSTLPDVWQSERRQPSPPVFLWRRTGRPSLKRKEVCETQVLFCHFLTQKARNIHMLENYLLTLILSSLQKTITLHSEPEQKAMDIAIYATEYLLLVLP